MIILENVCKKYHRLGKILSKKDTFWAIENLSLKINESESVGFIGPNGAGKTTLIRLIAGITAPTTGNIKVRGKILPLIGMRGALSPYLSGRENIYLLSSIFGINRKYFKDVFNNIVTFAEIGDFLDMQIIRYSTGMVSRLAFSIAVHMPFDMILMDEIFTIGDEDFQRKALNKIKEFKNEGKTIVFVSHNPAFIYEICENLIWMSKGRLVKKGNSKEVFAEYMSTIS